MGLKREREAFVAGYKACYCDRQQKGLILKRLLQRAVKRWEKERKQ